MSVSAEQSNATPVEAFCTSAGRYYPQMVEDRLRHHFDYYLGKAEVAIYSILALLLSVTVLAAIASAGKYYGTPFVTGQSQPKH
jgi:hypothetical protein